MNGHAPPLDSLAIPRFVGVPTFMRLPYLGLDAASGHDVAIYGIPSDAGGPFRTGARFGPQATRAQSIMLRPVNPYRGNLNVFAQLRVCDAGDTPVIPGYLLETLGHIQTYTSQLLKAGCIPFGIGGDHSITIAELRAVATKHGTLALVHFDAHTDTWPSYFDGLQHSAGTPFRRAVEESLIDPSRSIQIGMRGSLFKASDITQSVDLGYQVVTTDEALAMQPAELAKLIADRTAGAPTFLTFDMDFIDPAFAPGVQTPEAGGASARETLAILRALHSLNIVGADVVETNPLYDGPGQITALLTATIMAELLALIADIRKTQSVER